MLVNGERSDVDDIKKDTSSRKMKKIRRRYKVEPPCVLQNTLGGTPGEVGQKIRRATTNATSQEAEYGTIFGETDRNMDKIWRKI